MKNIRILLSENFPFLVVKFSIYLIRCVFVMDIRLNFFEWSSDSNCNLPILATVMISTAVLLYISLLYISYLSTKLHWIQWFYKRTAMALIGLRRSSLIWVFAVSICICIHVPIVTFSHYKVILIHAAHARRKEGMSPHNVNRIPSQYILSF